MKSILLILLTALITNSLKTLLGIDLDNLAVYEVKSLIALHSLSVLGASVVLGGVITYELRGY